MRRDTHKPKGVFIVPYLHAGDLLYKLRATYRGPAIKDLADGFKSVAAAQKWYTKSQASEPRDSQWRTQERDAYVLADLASIPGVTVARY